MIEVEAAVRKRCAFKVPRTSQEIDVIQLVKMAEVQRWRVGQLAQNPIYPTSSQWRATHFLQITQIRKFPEAIA